MLAYHGPIAQLGERFNGIEEVKGSTPLRSTIFIKGFRIFAESLFYMPPSRNYFCKILTEPELRAPDTVPMPKPQIPFR